MWWWRRLTESAAGTDGFHVCVLLTGLSAMIAWPAVAKAAGDPSPWWIAPAVLAVANAGCISAVLVGAVAVRRARRRAAQSSPERP